MRNVFPFVGITLALTGCPAPSPSVDAGADAPLIDSPTADTPSEEPDAPSDAGGVPRGAQVAVIQSRDGMQHTLAGGFYAMRTLEELQTGSRDGCLVLAEVGACRSVMCGGLDETVGAGTLSATGSSTLSAEPSGGRYFVIQASPFFGGGETIRFSATGDVVPAFTASVVAPSDAEMTFPTTISRGSATVTWTGTGGDIVELVVTGDTTVFCRADAAAGFIEIDASLLPTTGTATFTSYYGASEVVTAGDYSIEAMVAISQTGVATIE